MARELSEASMYYRISVKDKKAQSLAPEEALGATASLVPAADGDAISSAMASSVISDATTAGSTSTSGSAISVGQSWRVSDEEFIIKIDASPLHMSAAHRMFGGKTQKAAPMVIATAGGKEEDPIATIDDAPLHRSAAVRMFEKKSVKKSTMAGVAEGEEEAEEPQEEHTKDWSNFWHKMFEVYAGGAKK